MKCLHPIVLNIDAYGEFFRNVCVPCGKCEACVASRARDWQIRLREELKSSISAHFVTLTYDNLHVPEDEIVDYTSGEITKVNVVCKRDLQLFIKRLRKYFCDSSDVHIRYFLVSEYGPNTLRPHYHGIIFNIPRKEKVLNLIESCWQNGFVKVDKVTEGRIKYVTKYCFGGLFAPSHLPPNFMLCSKRPPIGYFFLDVLKSQLDSKSVDELSYYLNGYHLPIPKFYKRKLREDDTDFDKLQRLRDYVESQLWIDQADEYESLVRVAHMDAGGEWYETPSEYKRRRFLENFYRNFYKSHKL